MTMITSLDGNSRNLETAELEALKTCLRGQLLSPADPGYDDARVVWNADVTGRPALIARCAGPDDVVEAVRFARRHDILTSIRCGGHNIAGKALADNGLTIDLTQMNRVAVDQDAKTAVVGGGAPLGALDRATQEYGLATTAGVVTHTGVGGLTLGGGVGRLARKYGLACDNLLSMDVVTADGAQVTASANTNPELFWAMRGGGGNFGIVTAFEFRLHDIGTEVLFASSTHRLDDARNALRFMADFGPEAPREVTTAAALATAPDGTKVVTVHATHIAPLDRAEEVLRPLVEFGDPIATVFQRRTYVEVQSDADARFPYSGRYYWKTHLLETLSDPAVDAIIKGFRDVPDPDSMIIFQQFGGAVRDVASDATAFSNRNAEWDFLPAAIWTDPEDGPERIAWARRVWEAMRPHASGGVYLNSISDDDGRVIEAIGGNERRLQRVKAKWDPGNFFRLNANILPTTA